jgi:signal transduction histidine kinase
MENLENQLEKLSDKAILREIARRFEEKNASVIEMEEMTKKLLELNEKTKESEKIKSQFLSLIKNEFNNPISSVLNLTNSLIHNINTDRALEISKLINSDVAKLDFFFKNIFAATEIEAGEIANYYSNIKIDSILEDVLETIKYTIDEKKLKVEIKEITNQDIISDSSKIYLILLNLISNACEYSFKEGIINIYISSDDEYLKITVKDSGEGIQDEIKENIFNRFSKFNSGETRAESGLGLGLSVVLGEVEALGGMIHYKSQRGDTKFIVKIPKINEELADSSMGSNELFFDTFDDGENSGDKEF